MKKKYIQPESEIVILQPAQFLASSPGAGDQSDPRLTRELDLDFEDPELEQLLNM